MKRSKALIALSREHHNGLILARLIQKNAPAYKNLPVTAEAKAEYAKKFFDTVLQQHFRLEDILLQKLKHKHKSIETITVEISTEHISLSKKFNEIISSKNLIDALDILGYELEVHIRKEERVLFPLLEQFCSDEELETAQKIF